MADPTPLDVTALADPKRELRRRMRELRRAVDDRAGRSERIWAVVTASTSAATAQRVLAFRSLAGEPDVSAFEAWCVAHGVDFAVPEDDVDPTWPDVVVVPGLAFAPGGQRLGQGGGWYDRFLIGVRGDCEIVGVCFREQLVDELPTEPHDVAVDRVVTDSGLVV